MGRVRRAVRGLAALAILGALGCTALLGSLTLERRTELTLPVPTGPFAVGRTTFAWADAAGETAPPRRELLVWVWYPSQAPRSAVANDDYLPAPMRAAAERVRGAPTLPGRLMSLLTRDPGVVRGHSARNPELSPRQTSYPVVILRAGASSGVTNYTTLAEDLASHAYVVVGFDAAYRTGLVVFPDGRVIGRTPENNPELCVGPARAGCIDRLLHAWTADIAFVLDQLERLNASDASGRFAGRLDMSRVGVLGHSFGGAQAAQFCSEDARCKAGIDVDGRPLGGVVRTGIERPFLFLLSDHSRETGPETRQIQADIQSIYERQPPDRRLRAEIRGANHFVFSDDGALLKSRIVRGALRLFGRLGIDGRRQLAVTAYCVRSFFDAYLKTTTVSRPELTSPLYPELRILD